MYESLDKLFYKDPDHYLQIYEERINSAQAKKLNFYIGKNQAFFIENGDITNLVFAILKNDKAIYKLCHDLPEIALQQYSKRCLIDEIVLSNSIEGVHSSRKDINEALDILRKQSIEKGSRNRFTGLVNKYLKLSQNENVPLNDCRDIRQIYDEIVLEEVVSENRKNEPDGEIFRKEMVEITNASGKVIHKGLFPEEIIKEAIQSALAFLHDESDNRLYTSCLFHYMLEYIHPFYDGNGRLGRFIFSYCISKELEPLLAYMISETINENIKEYYDAFKICNHRNNLGDLTPFLIMMLNMVKKSSDKLIESLLEKLTTYQKTADMIYVFEECGNNEIRQLYELLIQVTLFGENGITTHDLIEAGNITYNTLSSRLDLIRKRKLLYEMKIGKQKAYSLDVDVLYDMTGR